MARWKDHYVCDCGWHTERALSGRCWLRLFCYVGKCRQIPTFRNATASRPRLQLPLRESLVRLAKERDHQAAKLAKVQELRDAIEAFMRSPQKKDDKARAWEFGNCIAYIKNGLDAALEGDKA